MSLSETYNEDCMVGMSRYPDKYFELAIVNPPFFKGVAKSSFYGRGMASGSKHVKRGQYKQIEAWDSNIPSFDYYSELCRISKEQIIWGINYFNTFPNVPVGRLIWDKQNDDATFSKAEIASCSLITSVQIFRYRWNGFQQGPTCQVVEKRFHPTQKPVQLYKWLLTNYAKPGDKILDTHLGSGSSRIAAYQMGFDFTGYEIDADYFEAQEKRFKEQTAQQSLFNPENLRA